MALNRFWLIHAKFAIGNLGRTMLKKKWLAQKARLVAYLCTKRRHLSNWYFLEVADDQ